MKKLDTLTNDEKLKIATYYADIAITRQAAADHFDISKNLVTKILHNVIEYVIADDKLAEKIANKAIENSDYKLLVKGEKTNRRVEKAYSKSFRIREERIKKIKRIEFLLSVKKELEQKIAKVQCLRFQIETYQDLLSSAEFPTSKEDLEFELDQLLDEDLEGELQDVSQAIIKLEGELN